MLPTNHGFDEFFGNLYHLNAEEEPEMYDYPPEKDFPELPQDLRAARRHPLMGDRQGRSHRRAALGQGRQAEDRGYRPAHPQAHGNLRRRFRRRGQEIHQATQNDAGKPFFVWLNTTHMHLYTHTKKESLGQAGRWQSPYHDTMIDHDKNVGEMLDFLDELGLTEDTFVMYSTDNGPHRNSWPDGGMTPFRSEKNTNWEGAFRIPLLVRWPGKIEAGSVSTEIVQHHDWFPTFLAMAGDPDVVEKLKKGYQAIGRTYKNHIDGYNLLALPDRRGEGEPAQAVRLHQRRRRHPCAALRQLEGRVHGAALPRHAAGLGRALHAAAGAEALQSADRSLRVRRHHVEHLLGMVHPARLHRLRDQLWSPHKFAETFKEFPPIQKPNSFTIDDAIGKMRRCRRLAD